MGEERGVEKNKFRRSGNDVKLKIIKRISLLLLHLDKYRQKYSLLMEL